MPTHKADQELSMPQLNLNGTLGQDLYDQYYAAWTQVSAALAALSAIDCHGRDYQTLPTQRWQAARTQHLNRIASMVEVRNELYSICLDLNRQLRHRRQA